MRFHLALAIACVAAVSAPASAALPTRAPDQAKHLAIRSAQVDGYQRLAEIVLGASLTDSKTVGAALGADSDAEVALRVFLRSARMLGDPRLYSDGVAEVDIEIPVDAVIQKVVQLCGPGAAAKTSLKDLRALAVDGYLRVSGRGRAPPDVGLETIRKVASARPDELVEMFPAGWQRVTTAGRVEAERQARIRAYAAMAEQVRGIQLSPTLTVSDVVGASAPAATLFDVFIRGLPVAGPARLMPDRIAEVDVAAPVRDIIKVLKDIRALAPADTRWTEDQINQLSIRLKTDRLLVTGRAMPPADQVRPGEMLAEVPGPPVPDWAMQVLEARGVARPPEDVQDPAQARLLAARSAKARAAAELQRQLDAVVLQDGRMVRDRAAKDEAFRSDIRTLLASAKTVKYQAIDGGKQWEAELRLPLRRLWEFSRPREE